MEECIWTYDGRYDKWDTSCNESFWLMDGTPTENKLVFCPYCGRRLAQRPADGRDSGEFESDDEY